MNHPPSAARLVCTGLLAVLLLSAAGLAQDKSVEGDLKKALQSMRDDRVKYPPTEVPGRVRDITWRLLLGELAGDPSLDLFSQSRQNLEAGLAALDKLTKEMLADKALAKAVNQNTALVVRLDAVKARRAALQEKLKLASDKEQQRLSRLRKLNSTYRQLTADMAAINTFFLLEDYDRVRALYKSVTDQVKDLQDTVADPRDYYLFKDEPRLDPAEKSELQLIMKTSEPVVQDMITHFKSLQALTAYRLAVANAAAPDRKLLDEAGKLAKELIDDKRANLLTYYVNGLSHHEQGLLATADKPLDAAAHKLTEPLFKQAR